jgi:citrate lyase subunit gamma (acyl carrier protein)
MAIRLKQTGQAGTIESSDILITVAPAVPGSGIVIDLTSPVMKKYGRQIREVITATITAFGVEDAVVQANDKGALDCTIRARSEAAVGRAMA